MPVDKGSNCRSQPPKGRPGVQRSRQVGHRQPEEGQDGITVSQRPYQGTFQPIRRQQAQMGSLGHRVVLPRSMRTEEQTLLPPPVETAPWLPPQSVTAVSNSCRLPPLRQAPSVAATRFSGVASGRKINSQKQLPTSAARLHWIPGHGSIAVWPRSCQPVPHRPTASAAAKGTGNVSNSLRRNCTESRGPCQQPVACHAPAYSRAAMTRRYTVRTGNGSDATAAQSAPGFNTRASTGASLSRTTGREAEHLQAMLAADIKGSSKGKSLGLHKEVFARHLPPLPKNVNTLEQPKRSHLVRAHREREHQTPFIPRPLAPESRGFSRRAAAAQAQHQSPALHRIAAHVADEQVSPTPVSKQKFRDVVKAQAKVPLFPERGKQALPGETEQQSPALNRSAVNDTDLSAPSRLIRTKDNFRDGMEEVEAPASSGISRRASAGQAQGWTPALRSHRLKSMDLKAIPKSIQKKVRFSDVVEVIEIPSSSDTSSQAAAEHEQSWLRDLHSHRLKSMDLKDTPKSIMKNVHFRDAVEEVETPAPPGIGRQAAAGQAQHHAPALHSHREKNMELKVTSKGILEKVHYKDAVEEEAETPASCGLDSQVPATQARHCEPASDSVTVRDPDLEDTSNAISTHLFCDVMEEDADETGSPSDDEKARSHVHALFSPDASEMILEEAARNTTEQVLIMCLTVIQETSQELVKHWSMTQYLDVTMAGTTSAVSGEAESRMSADHQGEAETAIIPPEADRGEVAALRSELSAPEAGASHSTPEAAEEEDAGASAVACVSQHPVSEPRVAGRGDTEEVRAGVSHELHVAGRFLLPGMPETLEELENSSMAHTRHRLPVQRGSSSPWLLGSTVKREPQQQGSKGPHLPLRRRRMARNRQVAPETTGKEDEEEELDKIEEEEWEEAIDTELSEGEEITISVIWVNPLVLGLFQDSHADPQEGSRCPSSMGMDVTGGAAEDQQRMSPVPAGPTGTQLAASTLGGAAEEEEHGTPLTPVSQEELALASASLDVDEQEATPQAESQALALLGPNASEVVPQEAALLIPREPPVQAMGQGTSQQLGEYQDITQILDVTMAPLTPAALEDEVAASLIQIPAAEPGTSHVPPGADGNGDAAASPLSQDSWHQRTVGRFVRKYLGKAVTVIRGTSQQQTEETCHKVRMWSHHQCRLL